MSGVVTLPPRLDLASVAQVAGEIMAARGAPLRLDASRVTHLGALGAQLLLAAARDWHESGQGLSIAPCSPAVDDALDCLGLIGRLSSVMTPDAQEGAA